jgi:hypothetical protein
MLSNTKYQVWPDYLKPATAAAMLNLGESTFRSIYPILVARHGLKIIGLSGPKFLRSNLLEVVGRLAERGLDVRVDAAGHRVWIGHESFPITTSRSGKSGRGRPKVEDGL